MGQNPQIVLASTSKYRKVLLEKLSVPFSQIDPDYIERSITDESPEQKALRLARGKAVAGAQKLLSEGSFVVIGSDQVASCGSMLLSKPGSFDKAKQQLMACSGQWVSFHTGLALVDQDGNELASCVDDYHLKFRDLPDQIIEQYLRLDEPYDCAGSIKAESHGILLLEETRGLDINTLYGLPLIKLTSVFMDLGLINNVN
jgi:MAF protein